MNIFNKSHLSPEIYKFVAITIIVLTGFILSGLSYSAGKCNGWGGETTKTVVLNWPTTLDLTISNGHANSVLASGSSAVMPIYCENDAGQQSTLTSVNWITGTSQGSDIRVISPGIGLRVRYVSTAGSGIVPSVNSGGFSSQTNGLNWTSLNWELIRLSDTVTPGTLQPARLVEISLGAGTGADGSGYTPVLGLISTTPVILSAACVLSVDKSLIILPDTSTLKLMKDGYSSSESLVAAITCPENTLISNGTTLTVRAATLDATDSTLVGNTGTARGIGIEVLDDKGNRVSANNGALPQPAFIQSDTAAAGVMQNFKVRMVRLPAEKVIAGTVSGTFTITLTVN